MSYKHKRASKPNMGFLRGMVYEIMFLETKRKARALRAQGYTVAQIMAALNEPEENVRILLMDWEYE